MLPKKFSFFYVMSERVLSSVGKGEAGTAVHFEQGRLRISSFLHPKLGDVFEVRVGVSVFYVRRTLSDVLLKQLFVERPISSDEWSRFELFAGLLQVVQSVEQPRSEATPRLDLLLSELLVVPDATAAIRRVVLSLVEESGAVALSDRLLAGERRVLEGRGARVPTRRMERPPSGALPLEVGRGTPRRLLSGQAEHSSEQEDSKILVRQLYSIEEGMRGCAIGGIEMGKLSVLGVTVLRLGEHRLAQQMVQELMERAAPFLETDSSTGLQIPKASALKEFDALIIRVQRRWDSEKRANSGFPAAGGSDYLRCLALQRFVAHSGYAREIMLVEQPGARNGLLARLVGQPESRSRFVSANDVREALTSGGQKEVLEELFGEQAQRFEVIPLPLRALGQMEAVYSWTVDGIPQLIHLDEQVHIKEGGPSPLRGRVDGESGHLRIERASRSQASKRTQVLLAIVGKE